MAEATTTTPTPETAPAPVAKRKKAKRTVASGQVHVLATFNNTIVTFTDSKGNVLTTCSAGACGFRGSKKGTAYAAQVAAERAGQLAKQQYGFSKADVFVKGIGLGRDAAVRTLANLDIYIEGIRDVTGVPHGGVRPAEGEENLVMARDTQSIVKMSRREGYALHPKAHKALVKRSTKPGQGVQSRGRRGGGASQYSLQLREKQKVKRLYGLLERQFSNLVKEASRKQGQSGTVLLQFLEQRADNVIYRAGFAPSRRAARQLVSHGHFLLNDTRVDVPSIRMKPGDTLTLRPHSTQTEYFKKLDDTSPAPADIPDWLKSNRKKVAVEVTSLPTRDDAEIDINEQLIVEYYSR